MAAVMTSAVSVVLVARHSVHLPGTRWEIHLHGKFGSLAVYRTGGPFGGWMLPAQVHVRRITAKR
jgi:hypothetical protein